MFESATYAQALRLLNRALSAGAVVELAGRALVLVAAPGPVVPHDRASTWLGFNAPDAGIYACCPLWTGVPAAMLGPAYRAWLRLGDVDELGELLPVAEWLGGMGEAELQAFAVGLLHGLRWISDDSKSATFRGAPRPLIRAPDSLLRELFG